MSDGDGPPVMNREELLEFAARVEACVEDDQWQVASTMINYARKVGAVTKGEAAALSRTLDKARRFGLSTVPLAIALELGRRIVPGLMGRGMAITGPSDAFPTDFAKRWSVKFDGVRLGLACTLSLAVAAAICRAAATERDRAVAAEFLRQRRLVSAEVAALRSRLARPANDQNDSG